MITKVIGIGAAGNKAAISATEAAVITLDDVLLLNSTLKDIPKDYKGLSHCFTNAYGGCGKERSIANELAMQFLQEEGELLNKFLGIGTEKQAELVVIVSSTEGGTGSGAAPVIAAYINDVLGLNVHPFAFTGFEEDPRGLKNTVEYVQEMNPEFTVEIEQNSKYMEECFDNKIKAEKAANASFCKKLSILMGNPLRDSDHNIDQTDLLKVSTTPGYMFIGYQEFRKVKNKAEFRKIVQEMIDGSKALDLNEPSQKRMAVIININKDNTDVIEYQDLLIQRFGMCFEKFEHIQHEESMPEFIAFISGGSRLPISEITDIYDKYKEYTGKVVKTEDDFLAKASQMQFNSEDDMFNLKGKSKAVMSKDDFFKNAAPKQANVKKKGFSNTTLKMETKKKPDNDVGDAY